MRVGSSGSAAGELLQRSAGVVLHPTSLPGPDGVGDLGPAAHRFVDFLAAAGQRWWQVLPLGPTGFGDSPYAGLSAFAGNPLLIDLDDLVAVGDLRAAEVSEGRPGVRGEVDYGAVIPRKSALLEWAAERFLRRAPAERREELDRFAGEEAWWLDDYALYAALKERHGGAAWWEWPRPVRLREPAALAAARRELAGRVEACRYRQLQFFRQWERLRRAAARAGVRILGDIPLLVAPDSADAWSRPELFLCDDEHRPREVAGVPPDFFSPTGQLWGNPLFDWEAARAEGYAWWSARVAGVLACCDAARLDHFRGFVGCWAVPAGAETAEEGRWQPGPGAELFAAIEERLGSAPLVAEDLGFITAEVEELRERLGLPGMKVLQFAFTSDADSPYLPHNFEPGCLVYTGTHDNDTTEGWYAGLETAERRRVRAWLGPTREAPSRALVRAAYRSVAALAMVPLQDHLGLGAGARMNHPARGAGNWRWRVPPEALERRLAGRLRRLAETYGRTAAAQPRARPGWM